MMCIWSFASFSFFIVPFFVTNLKIGDTYTSLLSSEVAEMVACVLCLFITEIASLKNSLALFSFTISAGSLGLLFVDIGPDSGLAIAALVFVTNFGVVCFFNIAYLVNPQFFPTILLATVYGCCNGLGRFITISAPVVGEIAEPWPLLILLGFSIFVACVSRFLI